MIVKVLCKSLLYIRLTCVCSYILSPREQKSNIKSWSPPIKWMIKLLSFYLGAWTCSYIQDICWLHYHDEEVHVNGIKIMQSINMAPGSVVALRCLSVSIPNPFWKGLEPIYCTVRLNPQLNELQADVIVRWNHTPLIITACA